jgi:hypothetical protein
MKKSMPRYPVDSDSDEEIFTHKGPLKPAISSKQAGGKGDGWKLSDRKKVSVSQFKGNVYVDIREYYEKDGELLPGKKGIALKPAEFEALCHAIGEIKVKLGHMAFK